MIKLKEDSVEFQAIKKELLDKAKKQNLDTLPAFLKELTENYQHDYGTICHAVAIAAIAAAWAVDKSPQGGITGFQAGAIMWQFIREWNYSSNKAGLKIVDYDNFLFPQYEDKFEKTIDADTWTAIKSAAQDEITKADEQFAQYVKDLHAYQTAIALYVKKYPDYYDRKSYYDPLGMGTGDDWAKEEEKKKRGFEFAPKEPYCLVTNDSRVYKHWESIVNGVIPFGFSVNP